jgi:glutamine synthetase
MGEIVESLMPTLTDEEIANLVVHLRDNGVTALVGTFLDNGGVARAKQVPLERIAAYHRNGLGCSYSWATFAPDSHLPLTPYFSVVGDMRLKVDLTALRILGDGLAWAPINIFNQDGSPLAHCARGALARQVAQLGADGYAARSAFEIEFTAFDATTGEPDIGVAYGLRAMMENEAFYADIAAGLRTAGIALEQLHAEAGVGQIELSTPPLDPVASADVLVVTRLILSRVARRHGKRVSFAPQSLANGIGNGAHVHFSLTKDDVPLFSGGTNARELTDEGAHAIGGLLQGLPDALGVLAPSLLSAPRLQPGMWSGAYVCWGCENREAAVRLCQATLGNPYGANVEIKVTDHSANPYAALAVVLGLAHRGILAATPLPTEAPVDPSDLKGTPDEIATFSTDQATNLAATCASPVLREILSDHMIEAINAVRGYEVTVSATKSYEEIIETFRFAWSS